MFNGRDNQAPGMERRLLILRGKQSPVHLTRRCLVDLHPIVAPVHRIRQLWNNRSLMGVFYGKRELKSE